MRRRLARILPLLLVGVGLLTGCDLQSVQDEVNDFKIIVELPPINTVANVQLIDLQTRQPIAGTVDLAFGGPDAGAVIDAYSDPIATARARGGFTGFGIANGRIPTESNPVRLRVAARADGYLPTTVPVAITDTGSAPVRILMVPDDPRQAPTGTSGTRVTATVARGTVTDPVDAVAASVASKASARIAPGTRLVDAAGDPLDGRLTVDLMSYENRGDGLRALPADVRTPVTGGRLVSAARLRITDSRGRKAASFQRVAKSGGTGLSLTLSTGIVTSAMEASYYVLRLQNGTDIVDVHVPASIVDGDSLTFGVNGSQLVVGDETHDISTLAATAGDLYISLQGVAPKTCTPSGTIQIDPNGHTGTATLTAGNSGLFYELPVAVVAGTTASVTLTSLIPDASVPSLASDWTLTAIAPNGDVQTATADVCGTTTAVTLPAPSSSLIDAFVSVDPGCPAGTSIPFTGNVDGYVLNYRKAGTTADFQPVPGGNVTVHSTDTAFQGVDVKLLNVEGGQDYEFYASFDGESGSRIVTMPTIDGGTTTITDAEFSQHCQ